MADILRNVTVFARRRRQGCRNSSGFFFSEYSGAKNVKKCLNKLYRIH